MFADPSGDQKRISDNRQILLLAQVGGDLQGCAATHQNHRIAVVNQGSGSLGDAVLFLRVQIRALQNRRLELDTWRGYHCAVHTLDVDGKEISRVKVL